MTLRRALFWLALVPSTIAVWAYVVTQPKAPRAQIQVIPVAPEIRRVHVCSSALYCWWHPDPPPGHSRSSREF
jgi:hypothetical protein